MSDWQIKKKYPNWLRSLKILSYLLKDCTWILLNQNDQFHIWPLNLCNACLPTVLCLHFQCMHLTHDGHGHRWFKRLTNPQGKVKKHRAEVIFFKVQCSNQSSLVLTCPAVSKISRSPTSPSITACCWYASSKKTEKRQHFKNTVKKNKHLLSDWNVCFTKCLGAIPWVQFPGCRPGFSSIEEMLVPIQPLPHNTTPALNWCLNTAKFSYIVPKLIRWASSLQSLILSPMCFHFFLSVDTILFTHEPNCWIVNCHRDSLVI